MTTMSREYSRNYMRKRRHSDEEFAERCRVASRAWRHRHPERYVHLRVLQKIKWDGLSPEERHTHGLRKYKITHADYNRIFALQMGLCAICKSDTPRQGKAKMFTVDHDHANGSIRGLLCGPCNRGIGYLNDDPARLQAAVNYLIREIKK